MRKVGVLFFAADPLSVEPNGRSPVLQLGDDVREVQERVKQSGHEDALDFDWRLAARTDDLPKALREKRPRVVHFSGHGDVEGVVLTAPDGYGAQQVDPAALTRIFEVFRHRVRLVVLSACYSQPQAKAIADVVGCAIGTSGKIMDVDAIRFNAAFYSAIACGESVQAAFDQASAEVELNQPRGTRPELHVGKGVNAARLFLVPRFRRLKQSAVVAAVLAVVAVILSIIAPPPPPPPMPGPLRLGDCTSTGAAPLAAVRLSGPAVASANPGSTSEAEMELAEGQALCRAGNYDSAVAHFNRASNGGNSEAMAFLAVAYLSGEGVAPDTQKAVHWLEQGAKTKRNPAAMNVLGIVYENDRRMHQRFYLARHWYEEAVELGYAEAMRNLARLYRSGLGVGRSDSTALKLLQQAVVAGSRDALVDIGRMYEEGRVGRADTRQAFRFYDSAAEAGSPMGMYMMGRMHQEGVQVRQNYGEARMWYLRGACAGSAEAMNNLGVLYEKGLGVKANNGEAIRWFRRAADVGSTVAAANLARLDADRPRGMEKALGWLDRPEPRIPPECERL